MRRFVYYFVLPDFPEWESKGRIYATPVYNAPEFRRVTKLYKDRPITDGHGWASLHLTCWMAAGLRAGTYLVHEARGLVLKLSEDVIYLRAKEWRGLADYAEIKYLQNKYKNI